MLSVRATLVPPGQANAGTTQQRPVPRSAQEIALADPVLTASSPMLAACSTSAGKMSGQDTSQTAKTIPNTKATGYANTPRTGTMPPL